MEQDCEEQEKECKDIILRIIAAVLLFLTGFLFKPLFIVSFIVAGFDVMYFAVKNIIDREFFDENFLMTAATTGAILIGEYPEAAMVMLLYQIGEYLQHRAVHKSKDSIEALMDIRPDFARINNEKIPPEFVKVNDIITVNTGEKIALDGIVVDGYASVDFSALTGESLPLNVKAGDEVLSGGINLNGKLKIKVTKEFEKSTVNKILELIEDSAEKKAKTENFIRIFAKVYTPIVVCLAFIIGVITPILIQFYTGEVIFRTWFTRALTFLVISCPCALVISIPLSFFAGIGGASSKGILIKGSCYIEQLAKVKQVVFDKTGTLTEGIFKVREIHSKNPELLKLAAIAESSSSHPIANAIKNKYTDALPQVSHVEEFAGKGVKVIYENNVIKAGTAGFIGADEVNAAGTVVHISLNDMYQGYIVAADEIKKNANEAITKLNKLGIKTAVLTGDTKKQAEIFKQLTGVKDIYAELLPQDKVEKLENIMKGSGTTIFVGDGINDAPVIKRADVGIAMGGLGSDAAIEASDVVIMDDNPLKVLTAVKIAKKTMIIVKQNVILAIGIKILFLTLGSLGLITMWSAVFADVGVALLAIMNALRARVCDWQNNNAMPATAFNGTGVNNSDKNLSGKGSSYPVPDVVAKRFNWGAFALDWIWGLGNKSYITLITIPLWCLCFIPQFMLLSGILSLGFSIWFGIKGNEWAWQNKHFNSVEAFHNYQRKWAIAGVICIIINVAIIPIIIVALTLPVLMSDTSAQYNHIARLKTSNTIKEITLMNEAIEEKCNLSSVGLAKCFEKHMSGNREDNIIKATDGSVWTFNGNGICQNNGDCNVAIEIHHNGKNDIATIPLYVNSKGYIYVNENDLKEYQNK